MGHGRLIAVGSPGELRRMSEAHSGRLLAVSTPALRAAQEVILPRYPEAVVYGGSIHLRSANPDADAHVLSELLTRSGVAGARVNAVPLSMDETFIDFIRSEERAHV